MNRFPVLDNHLHLSFQGENVEAVKRFEKFGGNHLILSHMPYSEFQVVKEKSFEKQFECTLKLAEIVRKETCVKVFVTLGPYPVELLHLLKTMSIQDAKAIMMKGMDLAVRYVLEKKAIALGEIGRPHFQVPDEILHVSNELMKYGFESAKETGCAVVLHTESASPRVFKELAELADKVGLRKENVVKHYSPPLVDEKSNFGIFPSILSGRENIEKAIAQNNRFLMETDFLDDRKRPGAVLDITTVPKRTKELFSKGILREEDIWKIHKENPEKVYGIQMDMD